MFDVQLIEGICRLFNDRSHALAGFAIGVVARTQTPLTLYQQQQIFSTTTAYMQSTMAQHYIKHGILAGTRRIRPTLEHVMYQADTALAQIFYAQAQASVAIERPLLTHQRDALREAGQNFRFTALSSLMVEQGQRLCRQYPPQIN